VILNTGSDGPRRITSSANKHGAKTSHRYFPSAIHGPTALIRERFTGTNRPEWLRDKTLRLGPDVQVQQMR
jgi:hypothetical protein